MLQAITKQVSSVLIGLAPPRSRFSSCPVNSLTVSLLSCSFPTLARPLFACFFSVLFFFFTMTGLLSDVCLALGFKSYYLPGSLMKRSAPVSSTVFTFLTHTPPTYGGAERQETGSEAK